MAGFVFLRHWNANKSTERKRSIIIGLEYPVHWLGKSWARRNYLKGDGKSRQGHLLLRQVVGNNKDTVIYFHSSRFCLMAKIRRYTRHRNPSISNSITLNPIAPAMTAGTYTCPDLLYALKILPSSETSMWKHMQLDEHTVGRSPWLGESFSEGVPWITCIGPPSYSITVRQIPLWGHWKLRFYQSCWLLYLIKVFILVSGYLKSLSKCGGSVERGLSWCGSGMFNLRRNCFNKCLLKSRQISRSVEQLGAGVTGCHVPSRKLQYWLLNFLSTQYELFP